jgi:alkanesulfonate monooxygenase SsuD/methylene tetrahydromethanopterin reductase-like flavin-dependent oxidoreductase (luciferase family)
VQRWNSIPFERPYQRTHDLVRFLRAAFNGERIDEDFETFTVRGFRQGSPPEIPPPIVIAALQEKMLRLAGREADGAMINWVSAEDAGRLARIVRSENRGAEIIDRIMVCPSDDRAAIYRLLRPLVASYTSVGVYRRFHTWLGRGDALADTWRAWDAGDRSLAAEAVPDEVIDELCVHGSPEQCRAHIRRYIDHGVTTPVIALMRPDGLDLRAALHALAPSS